MRTIQLVIILGLAIYGCSSPVPITANPDDHTTTTGTVGSAKSTNQLPAKPDNMKLPADTLKKAKDTLE